VQYLATFAHILATFAHILIEGKMPETTSHDLLDLTADIVSAYVGNNPLPQSTLPDLIGQVHQSLKTLKNGGNTEPAVELIPAVSIKKSVTPDYIISLEDGRKFKSMKRYLGLKGMTPAEYRQKWGLPRDYPMVAPNYAAARSELAKTMGLGRKPAASKAAKSKRGTPARRS
jgi:predicted transcriptional regulator